MDDMRQNQRVNRKANHRICDTDILLSYQCTEKDWAVFCFVFKRVHQT
jgi:hypothetical protein